MKVLCPKYPELYIHDLGVRFHKGAASVPDSVAKKLEAMTGFVFEFEAEPSANAQKEVGKRGRAGAAESKDT